MNYVFVNLYLHYFRDAVFLFRVFVALGNLSMITRQDLRNFSQARIAIFVATFRARVPDGTGAQACFVAFLLQVFTILGMTNLGTNVTTRHLCLAFDKTPSFRWKINHFF